MLFRHVASRTEIITTQPHTTFADHCNEHGDDAKS